MSKFVSVTTGALMLLSLFSFSAMAQKEVIASEQHSSTQIEQVNSQSMEKKISINSATAEELSAELNGIGLKKAQAIVEYRQQYGQFTHIEQLQEVPGIGTAIFERNLAKLAL